MAAQPLAQFAADHPKKSWVPWGSAANWRAAAQPFGIPPAG